MGLSLRKVLVDFVKRNHLWLGCVALVGIVAKFILGIYPSMNVDTAWACAGNSCHEKVLLLHGEVVWISSAWVQYRLAQAIEQNPDIKTVCISSNGGTTAEAMGIADYIYDHSFSTCLASRYNLNAEGTRFVRGLCQSACIWMVLAGRERILYDDKLMMGFHAASKNTGGIAKGDLPMFNDRVRHYTRLRPEPEKEAWELAGLTWWAFQQGATRKTTDCTASELSSKYPYFTDVRVKSERSDKTCGLQGPSEVKRSFPEERI